MTDELYMDWVGLAMSDIKGVAVIDTKGYNVREQVTNGTNQNMYINAFGTDSLQNIAASPLFHVQPNKLYPKFFIAKRGSTERIAAANEFIQKLVTNGVDVAEVDGSVYDHTGINNAIGEAGEKVVTPALRQFFEDCFD